MCEWYPKVKPAESGYYIEQVFPLYRVRFIAIGDNFDSNEQLDGMGGIDVAFRFLMHEYYSKDLSQKIKSAKRVLMQNGEHIVGGTIYGYRKNDAGKWEINPEPGEVVRQIFQLALEGLSTAQIRDKMCAARYLTPKEYADTKKNKEVIPTYMWGTRAIFRVLTNEQYTGSYVSGKIEATRIGEGARIEHDRSKWIIRPDSHSAIVRKGDFALIQEMLKNLKELCPEKPAPSNHANKLRSRIVSGERKSCAVPYGYIRGDDCEWLIDDTSAKAVRGIFDMTLQGLSAKEICDKLYESKTPTPLEYFNLLRGKDVQPTYRWPRLRIQEILKDEQYIGAYIAGKSFQGKDGKKYRPPKSEWIIIPDKHPAIVSKEVFDKVQKIRAKSRKVMSRRDYLLNGKTACGCGGFALVYGDSTPISTYRCSHSSADPAADCYKMKVNADELEKAVMTVIKKQAEVVLDNGDLSSYRKTSMDERRVAECERQIKQYEESRQACYERFVGKEIDRDTYQSLKNDCTENIERLKNQLAVYKQMERDKQADKKVAALAEEALSEAATPKDIVNALVDKVRVFPGNQIEILWKFANFAEEL